jgi:hypothetical protein
LRRAGHFDEGRERFATDERHVAIEHEHSAVVLQLRERLHDRMASAELLALLHPRHSLGAQRFTHAFAAVAVDDVDLRWLQRLCRVDDVFEQRAAGERLEHFGQGGLHPLPLPGCEDDDRKG